MATNDELETAGERMGDVSRLRYDGGMRRLLLPGLLVSLVACQGSLVGDGEDGGADGVDAAGRDAAVTPIPDGGPPPGTDGGPRMDAGTTPLDSGSETPIDAGPCTATGLADAVSSSPITGISGSGALFAAPTATGGVVVAVAGSGGVTLQRVNGDGSTAGAPVTVDGGGLWGLDVSADAWGVMVSRGSDALYLVVVRPDGSTVFEQKLLGEVDHTVTNNEWFGTGIRYGRLLWDGARWVAYYTVNRLWPDGIAHYGDQLTFWTADGSPDGTGWGWGCSHSMEVRVEHNGTILGPVCASDCYPSKGIHFNHRSAEIVSDESGSNCAGGYGTSLGGVVPMSDGFWVSFTATDGRASHDVGIAHVGNDRRADPPIWLTTDGVRDDDVHAARYGAGFVVAWSAGGTDRIARFDATGAMAAGPIDVPALSLAGATDFFVFGGSSDVGWVTRAGGGLSLVRLRSCE